MKRTVLTGLILVGLAMASSHAFGGWTATGSFKYQDREFDQNGFTGVTPSLPIRFAKVEVRYKQGNNFVPLATGATDASGNYSVFVNDTSTRDIQVRVVTISGVPDLFLQVFNDSGQGANYAVVTPTFTAHPPLDLNAGIFTALISAGGEAFNIYDVALNSIEYLSFLNGSRPGSTQELKLKWDPAGFAFVNEYIGNNTVQVAVNSPYNDTVIQHETGHYAIFNFSASDTPGGVHHLSNCQQDLRLAFDEGYATYFGQSVRRHFNLSRPHLYVKMTGAPGPGNLDFYFDVEDEEPFSCKGSTSEATIYAALWDMVDASNTPDDTPTLDEPWDTMSQNDAPIWDVMRNYLPSAANKSMEDFWDGWFIRGEGSGGSMVTMFVKHGVEFKNDLAEGNDDSLTAVSLASNGTPIHATYFKDVGNGSGTTDVDFFKFDANAGQPYRIETVGLLGDANTSLVLLGPDALTVIKSNDDRSPTDKSSLIDFIAATTATYYVKSFHGPGLGIYGSYDLAVGGVTIPTAGAGVYNPRPTGSIVRELTGVSGGDSPKSTGFFSDPQRD
jgi:hypothetical protein